MIDSTDLPTEPTTELEPAGPPPEDLFPHAKEVEAHRAKVRKAADCTCGAPAHGKHSEDCLKKAI